MNAETIIFEEKYAHEKGFAAHFDAEIATHLLDIEYDRLAALRWRRIANLIAYPLAVLIFWWLAHKMMMQKNVTLIEILTLEKAGILWPFAIIGTCLFVAARGPAKWAKRSFERTHRYDLTAAIMRFFKDANYDMYDHLRESEIKEFKICPRFNKMRGADLMDVQGRFVSSRLTLVNESSGENRKEKIKFKGVGVLITLPKPVSQPLMLTTDKGSVANWLEGMTTRYQRINLVDPVFEKIFEVYGRDQVQARMVLSTDVMEMFLRLNFLFSNWWMDLDEVERMTRSAMTGTGIEQVRDSLEANLMANYLEDRLLLLIHTPQDMFNPVSLDVSCLDLTPVRAVLYQVHLLNQLHGLLVKGQES
jgi:hypothetical protein